MPLPFKFDFKNPDYIQVYDWRIERLRRIREKPECLPKLKAYYRANPAQFIIDWGMTFDPRNIAVNQPTALPFLLFEKQEEWVNEFLEVFKNKESWIVEKSREMGMTWLAVATMCTMALFNHGFVACFASRKEDLVDKNGDMDSILQKGRWFIEQLPKEFRGYWSAKKHSSHMRIEIPWNRSLIKGEAGDNIGRGGRTSVTIPDEAAFLAHPEKIDAALSQTTNCRIDISTPNGMANPYARKRHSGNFRVFTFHWTQDPRKDQEWYDRTCAKIDDPVIIAQELDLDYSASVEGVIIPAEWVNSSVDAHLILNLKPSGERRLTLDVADEGKDKNALCGTYGPLVEFITSFSGKDSDIYKTVERTIQTCDDLKYFTLRYDADGLGAGVRGDANDINTKRQNDGLRKIQVVPFRGSGAVVDPDADVFANEPGETTKEGVNPINKDYFENLKAQAWFSLRRRFLKTHRLVQAVKTYGFDHEQTKRLFTRYHVDDLIFISSQLKELHQLKTELSQPTYKRKETGKLLVDKKPDGARSPNLADSVMMSFAKLPQQGLGFFDDWEDYFNIDEVA